MKILTTLFWLAVFVIGAAILAPIVGIGLLLAGSLGVFLIWLLPILIIAASDATTTGEKICWILAILCLSWFAWIFYFFLAPIKPRGGSSYDRRYDSCY